MAYSGIFGFVSISLLVVINIVAVAFSYGRLSQKVSDTCRRIDRLEAIINGHNPDRKGSSQ